MENMKYTINYCKWNAVAISCPTLEIYKKVTRRMKISSILRDYLWNHYKENTKVSYTFNNEQSKPFLREHACFGDKFIGMEIIEGRQFLKDNGVCLNLNYEIY